MTMIAMTPHNTAATQMNAAKETKIHQAAEGFVATYLSQFVEEMMTCSDMSDESSPEKAFYGSFLAEGLGKDLAKSQSAQHLVTHVEDMMRRQAGLKALPQNHSGYGAYQAQMTRENRDVSATTA